MPTDLRHNGCGGNLHQKPEDPTTLVCDRCEGKIFMPLPAQVSVAPVEGQSRMFFGIEGEQYSLPGLI